MPVELRALPKPSLTRSIVLVARRSELGNLPNQIGALCRRVLRTRYLPLSRELMPTFEDHLSIIDDQEKSFGGE
jgi:hypothetical protein